MYFHVIIQWCIENNYEYSYYKYLKINFFGYKVEILYFTVWDQYKIRTNEVFNELDAYIDTHGYNLDTEEQIISLLERFTAYKVLTS